ncbi:MAG: hypothetical protein ACI978_001799 [Oleispira sp.]|jgi:hypothetical protein
MDQSLTDREILDAIRDNDLDVLKRTCIDLSYNHENWKFAQEICAQLSQHNDPSIRQSAFYGLSMSVMRNLKAEKNLLKPVLLKGLSDQDPDVKMAAETAIQDINGWLKWNIGGAQKRKAQEKRYYAKKANK